MWAGFVARCLIEMVGRCKRTVEVTHEVFTDYNDRLVERSQNLIVVTEEASAKRNYYVNARGRMQVSAPWETCDYYRMTTYPNFDDAVLRLG
jgi:4-hydroxyacetophenone monooxygenase